jgi:hypothetical protein
MHASEIRWDSPTQRPLDLLNCPAIPIVSAETGENEPKKSTTPNNSVVNQNVLTTTRFA